MELNFMYREQTLSLWNIQLNDLPIKSLKTLQFYITVHLKLKISLGKRQLIHSLAASQHEKRQPEIQHLQWEKAGDNLIDEHTDNCCSAADVLAGDGTGFSF